MIDRPEDIDLFRFDLQRRAVVKVSAPSEFDAELLLLDAAGNSIGRGYGTDRTGLRLRRELEPGTYYFSVAAYRYRASCEPNLAEDTGRYRVHVGEDPPDDHGDLRATATILRDKAPRRGEIASAAGRIDPRVDVDIFRLELDRRTDLVVSVVVDFEAAVRILGADGMQIGHDIGKELYALGACYSGRVGVHDVEEMSEQQFRHEVGPGTYFVELWSWFGRAAGSYEMVVREAGPGDG